MTPGSCLRPKGQERNKRRHCCVTVVFGARDNAPARFASINKTEVPTVRPAQQMQNYLRLYDRAELYK